MYNYVTQSRKLRRCSANQEMTLVIYNPSHYFDEYAIPLLHVLQRRGVTVVLRTELPLPEARLTIIFCLLDSRVAVPTTPYIAVQLEQRTSGFFTPEYLTRLRGSVEVWDFCAANLPMLVYHGIRVRYVPLGRVETPLLPLEEENFDVLFLGALNSHRNAILNHLTQNGITVVTNNHTFRVGKQELLRRARLVLNIHYYPNAGEEQLRIIPALSVGKLVISEPGADGLAIAELATTPEEFLAKCRYWLAATPLQRQQRALEILATIPDFASVVPEV